VRKSAVLAAAMLAIAVAGVATPSTAEAAPEPLFTISKVVQGGDVVRPGNLVTFQILFGNTGLTTNPNHADGVNVTIRDPIVSPLLTFVSATDGGTVVFNPQSQANEVVWTIPSVPRGSNGTRFVTFSVATSLPGGAVIPDGTVIGNSAFIQDGDGFPAALESLNEEITVRSTPVFDISVIGTPARLPRCRWARR
jgi:hypothetical protein